MEKGMDNCYLSHNRNFLIKLTCLLFLWTLLLRFATFFKSVIDWDESLYILIADRWLSGNLPYIEVWDHKPIGIYTIFASALYLFGRSIISVRIAAIIFISLTSLILYLIGIELTGKKNSGIAASVLYPVYSLGLGGAAANTEPFFSLFNMLGLLLLLKVLREELSTRRLLLMVAGAGIAFGITLQIKYIVIFEIAYFTIAFIPLKMRKRSSMTAWQWISSGLVFSTTLLAPTAIALLYYLHSGYLNEFIYSNFKANQQHIEMRTLLGMFIPFARSMEKWSNWVNVLLVLSALGIAIPHILPGRGKGIRAERGFLTFLLLWLVVSLLECWLTFKFYPHYYLVTIPPLCLLAGYSFYRVGINEISSRRVVLLCLVISFVQLSHIFATSSKWILGWKKKDRITQVANYLEENISPQDFIYVVNDQPIYYFLTRARIPTRYAFPPFLIDPHFSKVAGIDYRNEIDHILSLNPKYILVNNDSMHKRAVEIKNLLKKSRPIEKTYGNLDIYGISSH